MIRDTNLPGPVTSVEERPIASGSWQGTFAGGVFKVLVAVAALALPLIEHRLLPLWVGAMLLAGGVAELAVGWASRQSTVGKVALGSGIMTVLAGIIFIGVMSMGLAQLTLLTIVWLVVRALISLRLGLQTGASAAARTLLLVRGATDAILGLALIAGLSVLQIAILFFGSSPAMATGFLVIIAISFGVAGVGLIAIAVAQRRWDRRHPSERVSGLTA